MQTAVIVLLWVVGAMWFITIMAEICIDWDAREERKWERIRAKQWPSSASSS